MTALALSVTSAMGIIQGCGGGGGAIIGAITRELLIARWNTVSMNAEGKDTTCPGTITLANGSSVSCSGFMQFNADNTYVANFGGTADSGTWTLSGSTVTLNSGVGNPQFVMTVTTVNATTLVVLSDGISVGHTKDAGATPTPSPTPGATPTPSPTPGATPTPTPAPTPTPTPTPTPRPIIKQTFSYTGTLQYFTVPAGVKSITVKIWGAGGGQGGGSGAFVTGNMAVTPGEVLNIFAGQGGQVKLNGTTSFAIRGGGSGNGDGVYAGGGGGGRTYITNGSNITHGEAGAGGGGQFYGGGGGGVTAGLKGSDGGGSNGTGGMGGTQSAGGSAGSGTPAGIGGSIYFGGNGATICGGGGAGFYGGGGGSGKSNGGGGGSSYTGGLTSVASADGKTQTQTADFSSTILPGGSSDPDYVAGVGVGRGNNQAGGNGYIVISYQS